MILPPLIKSGHLLFALWLQLTIDCLMPCVFIGNWTLMFAYTSLSGFYVFAGNDGLNSCCMIELINHPY